MMQRKTDTNSIDGLSPLYDESTCIHCNQCIHACKTHALSEQDHAIVCDAKRCIQCGFCVNACPTGAMSVPQTYPLITDLLLHKKRDNLKIAAIMAPETAIAFDITSLPSVLRKMGFDYVFDLKTSRELCALCYHHFIEESHGLTLFSPACPAMNDYIKLFQQFYRRAIIPLKSPAQILATLIRQIEPQCHIIYMTPCLAEYFSLSNVTDQILPLSLTQLQSLIDERYTGVRAKHTYDVDKVTLNPSLHTVLPLTNYQPFLEKTTNAVSAESYLPSYETTTTRFKDRRFLNNKRFIEPYFCSQSCRSGPGLITPPKERQTKRMIDEYQDLLQQSYPRSKETSSPQKSDHPRIAEFFEQTFHSIFRGRELFTQQRLLSEVVQNRSCILSIQGQTKSYSCSLDFSIFTE